MNFFRKKSSAFISLETPDFGPDVRKLWADLLFALEGHELKQVTIRLYDKGDLPMRVFSVIVSLGFKLKNEESSLNIEASARIVQMIRKLNCTAAFGQLTEVN
jgi:hypothetical protein